MSETTDFDTDAWKLELLAKCKRRAVGECRNVPELRACPSCATIVLNDKRATFVSCCPLCLQRFCFICIGRDDGHSECQLAPVQTTLAPNRTVVEAATDNHPSLTNGVCGRETSRAINPAGNVSSEHRSSRSRTCRLRLSGNNTSFGFGVNSSKTSLACYVGYVNPGSAADDGGLWVGDTILRVNDVNMEANTRGEVAARIRELAATFGEVELFVRQSSMANRHEQEQNNTTQVHHTTAAVLDDEVRSGGRTEVTRSTVSTEAATCAVDRGSTDERRDIVDDLVVNHESPTATVAVDRTVLPTDNNRRQISKYDSIIDLVELFQVSRYILQERTCPSCDSPTNVAQFSQFVSCVACRNWFCVVCLKVQRPYTYHDELCDIAPLQTPSHRQKSCHTLAKDHSPVRDRSITSVISLPAQSRPAQYSKISPMYFASRLRACLLNVNAASSGRCGLGVLSVVGVPGHCVSLIRRGPPTADDNEFPFNGLQMIEFNGVDVESSGLQLGDLLVEINGTNVEADSVDEIRALMVSTAEHCGAIPLLVVDTAADRHRDHRPAVHNRRTANKLAEDVEIDRFAQLLTCDSTTVSGIAQVPALRMCTRCGLLMKHESGDKRVQCPDCRCKFCFVCLRPQSISSKLQSQCPEVCTVASCQTPKIDTDATSETVSREYFVSRLRRCDIRAKTAGRSRFGFCLTAVKGFPGHCVSLIQRGSPAEISGLKVGDLLIEINGRNIEADSADDIFSIMRTLSDVCNVINIVVVDSTADLFRKEHSIAVKNRQTTNFIIGCDITDKLREYADMRKFELLSSCETQKVGRSRNVPEQRICPRCGLRISHEGGYKRVNCLGCGCWFCFVCLKPKNISGRWQCSDTCAVAKRQRPDKNDDQRNDTDLSDTEDECEYEYTAIISAFVINPCVLGPLKPLEGHIQLSLEPCCLTLDDSYGEYRAKMPCGDVISLEGMKALSDSVLKRNGHTFQCPECSTNWDFFLVRHVLSAISTTAELSSIEEKINANLLAANNIKRCPQCLTNCCREAGNNGNRITCLVCRKTKGKITDFCWNCSQSWKGTGATCGNWNCDTTDWRIRELGTCETKKIGPVSGVPKIRGCDKCGSIIQHLEKCKHVSCMKCKYSFCFVCLKPQNVDGSWPCGQAYGVCTVASRQTSLP